MSKRKNELSGINYLEAMLQWEAFAKAHPNFKPALQEVLDELHYLREKVKN